VNRNGKRSLLLSGRALGEERDLISNPFPLLKTGGGGGGGNGDIKES